MENVEAKIKQLVSTLSSDSGVDVNVDLATGEISINGIKFSALDQLEVIKEHSNDPVIRTLLKQINQADAAKQVRESVAFNAGKIELDEESLRRLANDLIGKNKTEGNAPEDLKDKKIQELENKIEEMHQSFDRYQKEHEEEKRVLRDMLHVGDQIFTSEKELRFPNRFANVSETIISDDKITDQGIAELVEELKGIEVPRGSFATNAYKDAVVIKTHDEDGIRYYVSRNYYYAYTGESV